MNLLIIVIFNLGIIILFLNGIFEKRNLVNLIENIKDNSFTQMIKDRIKNLNKKREEYKIIKEIYESVSFLRNIINMGKASETTTDYIISRLSEKKGILQKTYYRMLSEIRVGEVENASEIMANRIEKPIAEEFAMLLMQWDEIKPKHLMQTLISYQNNIREMNLTREKRKDEMISELIYFPVMANVMAIFLNFIYVAYFIEQKEVLSTLF